MKPDLPLSRYTLFSVVLLSYLLPLLALSAYNSIVTTPSKGWSVLCLGVFLTSLGSLAIFWTLTKWQKNFPISHREPSFQQNQSEQEEQETFIPSQIVPVIAPEELLKHQETQIALENANKSNALLNEQLEQYIQEMRQLLLENDKQKLVLENLQNSFDEERDSSCYQLQQQQTLIRELQTTLADQKGLSEKKQNQIHHLDTKVHDLTYEIKTLLKLAEAHSSSLTSTPQVDQFPYPKSPPRDTDDEMYPHLEKQIRSDEEASQQLKRCLDIAQKITVSNRFNSHINTFLDSPSDSFALDLRRLCDSLRSEKNSTVLLYSPKENKLLFVNNQIRALTGWSPEKFVQNFDSLLYEDAVWKQGISSLAMRNEAQIKLSLRSKTGQDVNVNAHLGMIPTGIFKHHTIAIVYPN